MDVLACNAMACQLIGDFAAMPPAARNMVRHVVLDPAAPALYAEWERVAQETVAHLRLAAAHHPDDEALANLVGELSVRSERFRRWWADHRVREKGHGTKLLAHRSSAGSSCATRPSRSATIPIYGSSSTPLIRARPRRRACSCSHAPERPFAAKPVPGAGTRVSAPPRLPARTAAADFDLHLDELGGSRWTQIARSLGLASDEDVTYNGNGGDYRWRVVSYGGAGAYTLGLTTRAASVRYAAGRRSVLGTARRIAPAGGAAVRATTLPPWRRAALATGRERAPPDRARHRCRRQIASGG